MTYPNIAMEVLKNESCFIRRGTLSLCSIFQSWCFRTGRGIFGNDAWSMWVHEWDVKPDVTDSAISAELYVPKKFHLDWYCLEMQIQQVSEFVPNFLFQFLSYLSDNASASKAMDSTDDFSVIHPRCTSTNIAISHTLSQTSRADSSLSCLFSLQSRRISEVAFTWSRLGVYRNGLLQYTINSICLWNMVYLWIE